MLNTMRNNFIMAPLKLGYAVNKDGQVNEKHINFYMERSKHVGAVTLEPLYIHSGLRELPTQMGIDSDDKIPGLSKLVNGIQNQGAKVIAHLNHPGRMANPNIPGNFFVSSTSKACENGGAAPLALTKEGIKEAIHLHIEAAIRAEKAGFDAIELQLGHGYLSAQFLSPKLNTRTDDYGGSFGNRSRFSLELFTAVKNAVNCPVIVRLTGSEIIPDGINLEEAIQLARLLKEENAEACHVIAGSACSTPPWFFQHMFIPKSKTWELASKIKNDADIPVISVGRITSTEDIQTVTNQFNSDYIAIGRALVADPNFIGKYLGTVHGNIKPCLSCSEGCLGGVKGGTGLGCIVNPRVGKENEIVENAQKVKDIAIVGGGVAGLDCAITLKQRGHQVTVFEKEKLGGQLNLAWLPPKKQSLQALLGYYDKQLKDLKIPVINKHIQAADLKRSNYNAIVLATGAVPLIPKINNLNHYHWAEYLKMTNFKENETSLIIGGGLIGCELASKLVDEKHKVIIVEMLDELARGMEMLEKKLTLKKLKDAKIDIHLNSKVIQISEDQKTITIENNGQEIDLKGIDNIIVATGMKAENTLSEQLGNEYSVHIIGDAQNPSNIKNAIQSAFQVGIQL